MTENYGILISVKGRPTTKVSPRRSPCALLPLLVCLAGVSGVCWWSERTGSGGCPAQVAVSTDDYRVGKRIFDSAQSPADYYKAAALIAKAARQGDFKAQTALAVLYIKGLGVTQDKQAGMEWLRKAVVQEFSVAQNELGVLYATGRGVPQDLNEALHWCSLAAAQGNKTAQHNLTLLEAAKQSIQATMSDLARAPYQKVVVQRCDSEGIMVAFQPGKGGIGLAKLKAAELSGPLQQLCGLLTEKTVSQVSARFITPALGTL